MLPIIVSSRCRARPAAGLFAILETTAAHCAIVSVSRTAHVDQYLFYAFPEREYIMAFQEDYLLDQRCDNVYLMADLNGVWPLCVWFAIIIYPVTKNSLSFWQTFSYGWRIRSPYNVSDCFKNAFY